MSDEFRYEYFSSVKQKDVDWLWYPYIPYGKLTVLQGDPGEGKSTFMLNTAALLTRGKPMPDGFPISGPQTVVYQCSEDDVADTIKPRLIAAGADCDRIAYIVETTTSLTLEDARIEKVIQETGARLVVLDPIQAFLPQDGDMQSASRMRSILGRLADIAEKYNCAVVLIGHMNKGTGGKNLYRSLGSIDIVAIARSVLMITRSTAEPDVRYMLPVKSSLAPEGCAIAFSFSADNGFQWIGPCDIGKEDMVSDGTADDTKRTSAADMLKEMLANEDLPSVDVLKEMSLLGFSRRTVFSAKKDIQAEAYRKDNAWYWRLAPDREENVNAD